MCNNTNNLKLYTNFNNKLLIKILSNLPNFNFLILEENQFKQSCTMYSPISNYKELKKYFRSVVNSMINYLVVNDSFVFEIQPSKI